MDLAVFSRLVPHVPMDAATVRREVSRDPLRKHVSQRTPGYTSSHSLELFAALLDAPLEFSWPLCKSGRFFKRTKRCEFYAQEKEEDYERDADDPEAVVFAESTYSEEDFFEFLRTDEAFSRLSRRASSTTTTALRRNLKTVTTLASILCRTEGFFRRFEYTDENLGSEESSVRSSISLRLFTSNGAHPPLETTLITLGEWLANRYLQKRFVEPTERRIELLYFRRLRRATTASFSYETPGLGLEFRAHEGVEVSKSRYGVAFPAWVTRYFSDPVRLTEFKRNVLDCPDEYVNPRMKEKLFHVANHAYLSTLSTKDASVAPGDRRSERKKTSAYRRDRAFLMALDWQRELERGGDANSERRRKRIASTVLEGEPAEASSRVSFSMPIRTYLDLLNGRISSSEGAKDAFSGKKFDEKKMESGKLKRFLGLEKKNASYLVRSYSIEKTIADDGRFDGTNGNLGDAPGNRFVDRR